MVSSWWQCPSLPLLSFSSWNKYSKHHKQKEWERTQRRGISLCSLEQLHPLPISVRKSYGSSQNIGINLVNRRLNSLGTSVRQLWLLLLWLAWYSQTSFRKTHGNHTKVLKSFPLLFVIILLTIPFFSDMNILFPVEQVFSESHSKHKCPSLRYIVMGGRFFSLHIICKLGSDCHILSL